MNDYIFYLERLLASNTPAEWVYDRVVADSFLEAYSMEAITVINSARLYGLKYKIHAAEIYNRSVVAGFTSSDLKKRAEDLIRVGMPFPEGFVLRPHSGPVDILIEETPAIKRKEPEVCLEVFFKGDRSHVDFSKITADLSKAPR